MAGQRLRIFVATGTGPPFLRLLRAVVALTTRPDIELFVQRGSTSSFSELPGAERVSREDFASRLAWADAVVAHGGAGTLYDARRIGHVPVVVPREKRFAEAVNDHQLELARALERDGHAHLCSDLAGLERAARAAPSLRRVPTEPARRLIEAIRQALEFPHRPPASPSEPR